MKNILINLRSRSLGDTIAIMPYLEKYGRDNNSKIFLLGNLAFANMFIESYPNIEFTDSEVGNWDDIKLINYKFESGVQQGMAEQLGYENPEYIRPKIDNKITQRPVKSKYITFSVHSTSQLKYWNANPDNFKTRLDSTNWNDLCRMFRKDKITPICLSQYELFGNKRKYNGLPKKAVKKIDLSLKEVINYIYHSEFYIGPSSGLAWVAHALGKPVVMISNFTEDWNEFDLNIKDYKRITNKNVCHGCWHTESFDKNNWEWCPKHQNTSREFECHTSITPEYVYEQIKNWI